MAVVMRIRNDDDNVNDHGLVNEIATANANDIEHTEELKWK
jgi:hypothetical protein